MVVHLPVIICQMQMGDFRGQNIDIFFEGIFTIQIDKTYVEAISDGTKPFANLFEHGQSAGFHAQCNIIFFCCFYHFFGKIAAVKVGNIGNTHTLKIGHYMSAEQFGAFDEEGIPRLKPEEGTIEPPLDPLEAFVGLFDSELI